MGMKDEGTKFYSGHSLKTVQISPRSMITWESGRGEDSQRSHTER
jgi:hypothetical protein